MAAPIGNQFWKMRTKHGRDRLFTDPEALWAACCEYFEWVEANPLIEMRPFAYQGVVIQEPVPKMRAMTLSGLQFFLDVDVKTWINWRNSEDFVQVVSKAESVIRDQKFAGAAADLLNSNIIARDLGLSDKIQQDHTSSDGSMTPKGLDASKLSTEALAEIMAAADAAKRS